MYCFHVKRSEDNHASTSGRVLTTAKRNLSRLGLFRLAGRLGVRLELLKPTSCETSLSAELRNNHDAASIEKNGNLKTRTYGLPFRLSALQGWLTRQARLQLKCFQQWHHSARISIAPRALDFCGCPGYPASILRFVGREHCFQK
jgi:hypothetical protein